MPIQLEDLSVLAYANGFTLWHYRTSDALADLCTGGGLDGADDMLRPGDLVIASGGNGRVAAAGLIVVGESTPNGITATPLPFGGVPGSP